MPSATPANVVEIHGYALRVIREAKGRRVAYLAGALGVDRSYITHIERGTKRKVSHTFYGALCVELQIEDQRALLATAPVREDVPA